MNIDESILQYLIYKHHNFLNVFPNIHTEPYGGSEVDALYITNSGYPIFYEIKCSLSDFKNDLKKKRHKQLTERSNDLIIKPKQFIYICKNFIPDINIIPDYAGCFCVNEKYSKYWIEWSNPIKKPPILYREKLTEKARTFLNKKIYFRFLEMAHNEGKNKYYELKEIQKNDRSI